MGALTPDTIVLTGILVHSADRMAFLQTPASQPNAVFLTLSPLQHTLFASINPTLSAFTPLPTFTVPLIPPLGAFAVTGSISQLSLLPLTPSTGINIFANNVTIIPAFHM